MKQAKSVKDRFQSSGHIGVIIAAILAALLFFSSCTSENAEDQLADTAVPPPLSTWTPLPPTPTAAAAASPTHVLPTIMPTRTEVIPSEPSPTLAVTAAQLDVGCAVPGEVAFGELESGISAENISYRIYLPPCFGQDGKAYPAIYLFHGSHHDDSHWDDLGITEAAEDLIASGQIPPVIIVMPDGGEIAQDTSGGPHSFEGVVVQELIPHIENNFCALSDPKVRAVGGLSRGGYWSLEITFQKPDHFVSVGGHSAALLDESAGSDYDPLVSAKKNDVEQLRIYLDAGRLDYVLPQLSTLHDLLLEEGIGHEWVLNEGSHQDSYWTEHLEEYLIWYAKPWLDERSLYPDCEPLSLDR